MKILISLVLLLCFIKADMCDSYELKETINFIKSQLPTNVDHMTVWTNVSCKNDTVVYDYEIDFNKADKKVSNVDKFKDLFEKLLKNNNKQYYCDSNLAAFYRENNVGMQWIYNTQGKEYINIKISLKDCK